MPANVGIFEPNFGAYTDWKAMLRELVTGQIGGAFTSTNLVSTGVRGQLRMTYYAAVATVSQTNILTATALTASAQAGYTTGIVAPDVPRVARIVATKTGVTPVAGNVVIHGTDINNATISDTIALNDTTAVNGVKAFKTITSVDLPAQTNAGGDTVSVGGGAALGLQDYLFTNTLLAAFVNKAQDTTPDTVTTSTTVLSQNTAASATAYAAHSVLFVYIAEAAS